MTAGDASARSRTASLVLAGISGALFGAGLVISGLVQPARIIGLLDVFGHWDPTLVIVMAAAIAVYAPASRRLLRRRQRPWFEVRFHVPTRRDIDAQLVIGAAIFGIGWGIGGLCPGPGIVAAGTGSTSGVTFLIAMLAGMYAQHRIASEPLLRPRHLVPRGSPTGGEATPVP
ncbi:MAG TPA: DUF6691 family protein [Kofleriaceae bacterium]|nr:DUF6691 family protein [Kofleriaceae bacterium]